MIYKIQDKKIQVIFNNDIIELPINLKEQINKNFESIKKLELMYGMETYFVFRNVI